MKGITQWLKMPEARFLAKRSPLRGVSIGQKNDSLGLSHLAPSNPPAPIDDKLDRS
jgi:hypothetical protein